jgi:hypothetical protein
MAGKDGRLRGRVEAQNVQIQRFQVERLQMEQNTPTWVFKLIVSPKFTYPTGEYTLRLNGVITPERLFNILKVVEAELADALIR